MDYLSGKQNSNANIKNEKSGKIVSAGSNFTDFCDYIFLHLNPDEKAEIKEKFLTAETITVLKDNELVESVNNFFKNNLNISETSRNAFLHRNTLLYRIEKIHKITGLNVRNFEDALYFKLLTIIYFNSTER